jgi:hypothetical protein
MRTTNSEWCLLRRHGLVAEHHLSGSLVIAGGRLGAARAAGRCGGGPAACANEIGSGAGSRPSASAPACSRACAPGGGSGGGGATCDAARGTPTAAAGAARARKGTRGLREACLGGSGARLRRRLPPLQHQDADVAGYQGAHGTASELACCSKNVQSAQPTATAPMPFVVGCSSGHKFQ